MAEENITETTEKKTLGAKMLSKFSMIFAGLWIIGMNILKGFGKINLTESEIIWSGVAIAAVWTPTYFSVFLDKIKEIRFGE